MDLTELDQHLAALDEQELLTLPTVQRWLQRNVEKLRIDAIPDDWADDFNMEMTNLRIEVIRRDGGTWGVRDRLERLLREDGTWHEWPVKTSQVPKFRFTLAQAIANARVASSELRHMGMTPQEFIEWLKPRYAERGIDLNEAK